jgi:hypothetical protein
MSDSTTPQDSAAMSPASTGSVKDRCGLVAAMIQTGEDGGVFGIRIQERDDFPPKELIPLYLSPQLALTPTEREAIGYAAAFIHDNGLHRHSQSMVADAATLRGLLERLG